MKLKLLKRTHPDYDRALIERYGDLFAGGASFRKRINRYLPVRDLEPAQLYKRRSGQAHYLNYVARIGNFYASWLFTSALECEGSDDAFYAEWAEDVDGHGTDHDEFLRCRFVEALQWRCAYWRPEFPPQPSADDLEAMNVSDWEAAGFGRPVLKPIKAEAITNWERGPDGAWTWVLEHDRRCGLADVDAETATVTETWTCWYADGTVRRWEVSYPENKGPGDDEDVPEVEAPINPFGRIPIVCMELPTELWLVDNLADAQMEHFRTRNALSWALDRSCFVMPVLKSENNNPLQTMGSGYYHKLGVNESLEYPEIPSSPFAILAEYCGELKEEIFRLADQMADAVTTKASSTARSAASKSSDKQSTRIVLEAYGEIVREAWELTLDLVSAARGEDVEWNVSGMDSFDLEGDDTVVANALAVQPMAIPSPTFQRQLHTKVALTLVDDAPESVKELIRKEIESNTVDEEVLNPVAKAARMNEEAGMTPAGADPAAEPDADDEKPGGKPPPKA